MKRNTKILIVVLIVILIILGLFFVSQNKMDTVNTPIVSEQSVKGCYVAHLVKDVFILTVLSQNGKDFEGTLDIKNFEKDSSIGTLKGTFTNGILLADYTFQSEGVWSVGQVIFKKVGDEFIRGYGKPDDATGTRFVDLSKINYDSSVVYKKVSLQDCPVLPQ